MLVTDEQGKKYNLIPVVKENLTTEQSELEVMKKKYATSDYIPYFYGMSEWQIPTWYSERYQKGIISGYFVGGYNYKLIHKRHAHIALAVAKDSSMQVRKFLTDFSYEVETGATFFDYYMEPLKYELVFEEPKEKCELDEVDFDISKIPKEFFELPTNLEEESKEDGSALCFSCGKRLNSINDYLDHQDNCKEIDTITLKDESECDKDIFKYNLGINFSGYPLEDIGENIGEFIVNNIKSKLDGEFIGRRLPKNREYEITVKLVAPIEKE